MRRIHIRPFFHHAALLAGVNILLRLIGVSFNAFVSRKIGAEGMGLLTLIMSVYGLSLTLATSGVNLAAVRLTARVQARMEEGHSDETSLRAVVRACVLYSLLFGIGTAGLLFAFSAPIGEHLLGDVRTIPSLRALALSMPAVSLSSALAGYFTGRGQVIKNAAVTLTEQMIKIFLTAALLILLVPGGIEYACLAVVGGGAIAEGCSLCASVLLYLSGRPKIPSGAKSPAPLREVACTAFPVAVGGYARQGLLSAEHMAIPRGLRQSGASSEQALASYGVLHGMVYPLIFFPSAVLGAFSSLLVPEFAACHEKGERQRITRMAEKVLSASLLFSIGVAGIFISFAYEIGVGLYPGADAHVHLAIMAPLIPVMYLDSAVDGMLKGLGEQLHSMRINILDSLLCLILVLVLLPRLGLWGYYITQYVCELLNATLSISRLLQVTKLHPRPLQLVGVPLLAVILSTSAVRLLAEIPSIPLIGAAGYAPARICAAVLGYLGLIFAERRFIERKRKKEPAK